MATLSLKKKPSSPFPESDVLQHDEQTAVNAALDASNPSSTLLNERVLLQSGVHSSKHVRKAQALSWLKHTFPLAFVAINQRPLKKGIHKDVFKHIEDMVIQNNNIVSPNLDDRDESLLMLPSKRSVRESFNYYTNNIYYQKSIIDCSKRIDLNGDEVEDISDLEKESATLLYNQKSEHIKNARRLKRKKRRTKTPTDQSNNVSQMPTDKDLTPADAE
jgi:sRNA-binding protein